MANKCVLILVCCCMGLAAAYPSFDDQMWLSTQDLADETFPDLQRLRTDDQLPLLLRPVRSPDGSVSIDYSQTPERGREAAVQYNQNLARSDDGRFTVDAYARGSRNFDYNRNDYGGGIQGSWRF